MPPVESCEVIVGNSVDIRPDWLAAHQRASVLEQGRRLRLMAANGKQGKHIRNIATIINNSLITEDGIVKRAELGASRDISRTDAEELLAEMRAAGLDTSRVFPAERGGGHCHIPDGEGECCGAGGFQ